MNDPLLLSFDCGTQSLRALLFDPEGRLVDMEQVRYAPYSSPRPGWAEQDPEVYWEALKEASSKLAARRADAWGRVAAAGVAAQRDTVVLLDAKGNVLRPAIVWLDQRRAVPPYRPRFLAGLAYSAVGMREAILKTQAAGKTNWVRQNEPDVWERTATVATVSGFLHRRLVGSPVDSTAALIGHLPFDYKAQAWASPGHLNARIFPVEPEKLPPLAAPGTVLGQVGAAAAELTGMRAGLPVVACGSDKGCETIAMGVLDGSAASLSFGTTATVQTTSDRWFEPQRFMPSYPAPVPGRWNPEVEIFRGYWMITWFKEQFAHPEVQAAVASGVPPEALLDDLLRRTPAGAMGLIAQPYWCPGLKTPSAKGAIVGFGDVHERAHVYRAIVEGLAFALSEGLRTIERSGGTKAERIYASGGASRSDEICRIAADVFGLPLRRGETCESTGLGAAMVAAAGVGIHGSVPDAVRAMVRYGDSFDPDPARHELYRALYGRVYAKIYKALEPLYEEIRDIVGYPEKTV